jgi:hypothetical protein
MHKPFVLILLVLLASTQLLTAKDEQVNLKLWYNKPALKWTEALPIGNGRLCFGEKTVELQTQKGKSYSFDGNLGQL